MSERTIRCLDCDATFRADDLPEGTHACPSCGSTGLPVDVAHDVLLSINWHELRIICMWADNWAQRFPQTPEGDRSRTALRNIFKRIYRVKPEDGAPLTLREELQDVSDVFETDVTLSQGGQETTFHPHPIIDPEEA